ncbi:transcriptional regulator [Vibrio sp. JCM 19236]|nr:transcriptional regulator [Vibrio sp. JCM 19236]
MIRYYFGNKEGLFEAMILHVMAPILAHARNKLSNSDSNTLVEMMRLHFEVMSQDLAFPRLLFRVLGMPPSEVQRRLTDKMFEQMVGNMNERMFDSGKGIVRDGLDPQKCKLNILSLMLFPFIAPNALLEKHGIELDPEFLNDLFAHNIDVMFNGILQQPADKTSLTNED